MLPLGQFLRPLGRRLRAATRFLPALSSNTPQGLGTALRPELQPACDLFQFRLLPMGSKPSHHTVFPVIDRSKEVAGLLFIMLGIASFLRPVLRYSPIQREIRIVIKFCLKQRF